VFAPFTKMNFFSLALSQAERVRGTDSGAAADNLFWAFMAFMAFMAGGGAAAVASVTLPRIFMACMAEKMQGRTLPTFRTRTQTPVPRQCYPGSRQRKDQLTECTTQVRTKRLKPKLLRTLWFLHRKLTRNALYTRP
jgi:hypothetical protein